MGVCAAPTARIIHDNVVEQKRKIKSLSCYTGTYSKNGPQDCGGRPVAAETIDPSQRTKLSEGIGVPVVEVGCLQKTEPSTVRVTILGQRPKCIDKIVDLRQDMARNIFPGQMENKRGP